MVDMSWEDLAHGAYNAHGGANAGAWGNLKPAEKAAWKASVRYVVQAMQLQEPKDPKPAPNVVHDAPPAAHDVANDHHPKPESEQDQTISDPQPL